MRKRTDHLYVLLAMYPLQYFDYNERILDRLIAKRLIPPPDYSGADFTGWREHGWEGLRFIEVGIIVQAIKTSRVKDMVLSYSGGTHPLFKVKRRRKKRV